MLGLALQPDVTFANGLDTRHLYQEVGGAVSVSDTCDEGHRSAAGDLELACNAGEGAIADESEGLVPRRVRIGIDAREVDSVARVPVVHQSYDATVLSAAAVKTNLSNDRFPRRLLQ